MDDALDDAQAVYLGGSAIQGVGVFAARAFATGEFILAIDDSRVVDADHPLDPAKGELEHHCDYLAGGRVVHMQLPERHINHACDPNTYVKTVYPHDDPERVRGVRWVVARRAVAKGEEITYDYCINGTGDVIWQCNCSATTCRHTIHSDFFDLPVGLQLRYLPLLDDWYLQEHAGQIAQLREKGTTMADYDLLIRNAKIIDGTGNPWQMGDVLLRGDTIAAVTPVGAVQPSQAVEMIDAGGKVLCPGFIDIQSHAILPLMVDGRCVSKITQGITTEIMGEAWTPAPVRDRNLTPLENTLFVLNIGDKWRARIKTWGRFRDWLEAMVEHGVTPNIGSFLGGGTLRSVAKGMEMGKPTDQELALMQQVMAQAMEDGAFGVSYALIYPPDAYTDTAELVEICKVVARYNGVYITHVRSEAELLEEAIGEAIEIGRRSGAPVEIYHLKASGPANWHKIPAVMAQIDQARAQGLDVTADMYPYAASGTGLTAVLPPWSMADGKLFDNLRDPEMRAKIRAEMLAPSGDWEAMATRDPNSVMPIGFEKPENKHYVGKRLPEIAAMRNEHWVDTIFELLLSEEQRISTIYFSMDEDNVRLQLTAPWIKIATDAGGFDPAWAKPLGPYHPRAYGTYPRVLGKYVREEGVISLEDAVRKMTSSVATRLGIRDRGLVREGYLADLVIFDPDTVGDRATFEDPHQLSVGIEHVWVNGVQVVAHGNHTGATPGRIVDGPGRKQS